MIPFWLLLIAAVALTAAQDVFPGNPLFHKGWYNVIDAALLIVAAYQPRKNLIALCGAGLVVIAGVASGLMGPDTHTVIGAPGATVSDDQIGSAFIFPLAQPGGDTRWLTVLLQNGPPAIAIGSRRYAGGLVTWQTPRVAVWVSAGDRAGNALTITQPSGATFLSPVLSMQQTTTIAGMRVQYDSFAVPAMRKTVKAVYFGPDQAARLGPQAPPPGEPAILFAVADRADRPVAHGIGIVANGAQRVIGGLRLGARAAEFPAIVVASAPYLPALFLGAILLLAGAARTAYRSRT